MNKKLGLKILLQNPFAVAVEGIRVRQQNYFKRCTVSKYNIKQIPTIDLLDLFPDLDVNIDPYSSLVLSCFLQIFRIINYKSNRYL